MEIETLLAQYRHFMQDPAMVRLDRLPREEGPVLILMEGLLMYLHPQEVAALLQRLVAHFPHCRLVFDAYSSLTVRGIRFQPGLRRTGARIFWGWIHRKSWNNCARGYGSGRRFFLPTHLNSPFCPAGTA